MMNLTWALRPYFLRQARRMDAWACPDAVRRVQTGMLRTLLHAARDTAAGRLHGFRELLSLNDEALPSSFAESVPQAHYELLRPMAMRMLEGERDVLWPGRTRNFAQSSGTSGGKSKYVPVTPASLRMNHFAGASDAVAAYLRLNRGSRLFSGKALILGGSFANELGSEVPAGVCVGDLSATLIDKTPWLGTLMRTPAKKIALMPCWEEKLPALVEAARRAPVTSLSGVPSWFLILLRKVMEREGARCLHEVWPGLEVFFHGGISFEPYRAEYASFTDASRMHFLETYNASEGFFAVQTDFDERAMQLLLDRGVYYEFSPMRADGEWGAPLPVWEVEPGRTYSMLVTSCNGLWRYAIGDTVRFTRVFPHKLRIAGRTRSFINAFGEELMECNAESAVAEACRATGVSVSDYTAGPVYAHDGSRGRHRWLVEFTVRPASVQEFAMRLDAALQRVNSDYQAKRAGGIFLDPPEVVAVPAGHFAGWLARNGNGKLGGQRKIPRLCPTADRLASFEPR